MTLRAVWSRRERPRWTLAAVSLGGMMVGLDGMALAVAGPDMARSVGASFAEWQWIANAYLLALAGTLFPIGHLADRAGRRMAFVAGVLGFGLASLLLGFTGSAETLIALRAAQGVAGAALQTAGLALLRSSFPRHQLGAVLGIWGGASMLAVAAGPVLGGVLVGSYGWRVIFELNTPVAVAAAALAFWAARESRTPDSSGLLRSLRRMMSSRPVAAGVALTLCGHFGLFGLLLLLALYLQNFRGLSPLTAGMWLLPITLTLMVSAPAGGALSSRFGSRGPAVAGMMLISAGLAGFSQAGPEWTIGSEILPAVVLGLGIGISMVAATQAIVTHAPAANAALASALQQAVTQVGGVLGILVLGTVLSWRVSAMLRGRSGDADLVAQGRAPAGIGAWGQQVFMSGFQTALVIAAVVVFAGGLIGLLIPPVAKSQHAAVTSAALVSASGRTAGCSQHGVCSLPTQGRPRAGSQGAIELQRP